MSNEMHADGSNTTSMVLFRSMPMSWIELGISYIRKNWDVENGIATFASTSADFSSGARQIAPDVFSALLVFDVLPKKLLTAAFDRSLKDFFLRNYHPSGINYFFVDRDLISPSGIAADVDTAAMYLTIMLEAGMVERESIRHAVEIIAENVDSNGIIQVFLPPRMEREGRIDPAVCANVLGLLYCFGYEGRTQANEDYLFDIIASRAYLSGSLQYTYPSTILYFITRAIFRFGSNDVRERFLGVLGRGAMELLDEDPVTDLDLAMRVIVSKYLGIESSQVTRFERLLLERQMSNGSWRKGSMYRTVRSQLHFGSESLTTAFALRALTDLSLP